DVSDIIQLNKRFDRFYIAHLLDDGMNSFCFYYWGEFLKFVAAFQLVAGVLLVIKVFAALKQMNSFRVVKEIQEPPLQAVVHICDWMLARFPVKSRASN